MSPTTTTSPPILRRLSLQGVLGSPSPAGLNAIRFLSGAHLRVEDVYIQGFSTHGIDMTHNGTGAGQLTVKNTSMINLGGTGVNVAPTLASSTAMLDRLLHHGHLLKCGPRSWRTKLATTTAAEGQ